MTPREYIRSLKIANPLPVLHRDELSEVVKSQIQNAGCSIDEWFEKNKETDFAEGILSLLKPHLPPGIANLFDEGFIAVGEVNEPSPNLYVKSFDDMGYAIIFNTGMKDFIYRVARVLSTRFIPKGEKQESDRGVPDISETARIIAEIFWWFQETGSAFGPEYSIQQDQMQLANLLSLEAEKFLLLHEIGHIFDMMLEHSHPLFSETNPSMPAKWREESTADLFALYISMELNNPDADRRPFWIQLRYAGIEFAIQIYRALERIGFNFEDTHPPATQRLDFIRSKMKDKCDSQDTWQQLSMLSMGIGSIFDAIVDILIKPDEYEKYFTQQVNSIFSELDRLLDTCTGGMTPDYVTFYSNAGKIFGRGYSHMMLEKVAGVVSNYFDDLDEFKETGTIHGHDKWIHFQKFKLLWAFINQYMTEPARSAFLQVFEPRR